MRLLVDLRSHLSTPVPAPLIIQAQRVPVDGVDGQVAVNGKYVIPMPLDADFPVTVDDHILDATGDIDATSLVTEGYASLLAQYPQYANIYFNPLLTSDNVKELVLDNSFWFTDRSGPAPTPPATYPVHYTRIQTGREEGVAGDGQMPTHTALLANNTTLASGDRPGILLSYEIDIDLATGGLGAGADEFMLYWRLYEFTVTEDIAADAGLLSGQNSPALRYLKETDDEPSGFSAYISTDDGSTWCAASLLEPVAFVATSTLIRIAFRNDTTDKIFLAAFAMMF